MCVGFTRRASAHSGPRSRRRSMRARRERTDREATGASQCRCDRHREQRRYELDTVRQEEPLLRSCTRDRQQLRQLLQLLARHMAQRTFVHRRDRLVQLSE
jgi:hypothetical protein